jgi:predicted ATPase
MPQCSLDQLTAVEDPAWPIIHGYVADARHPVELLPAEREQAVATLLALQVTTRSPLGAFALETGGIYWRHDMKRHILTGTPGSGKTTILHALKRQGFAVVEEAATDVIALEQRKGNLEPWSQPDFIEKIVRLQQQRQLTAATEPSALQFYDRSPLCTYALSRHLGYPPSPGLLEELERMEREHIYQKQVFFIDNLGIVEPTEARRIGFEEALRFEHIHEDTYASFGYDCIHIAPASLAERVSIILAKCSR